VDQSLQRIAWKHAKDVEYVPPKYLTRPGWGASTPEGADGKKR
jgi:hypothetical protein